MKLAKSMIAALAAIALSVCAAGCMQTREEGVNWRLADSGEALPELPEKLEIGRDGLPRLKVYDVARERVSEMDVERYVAGVVAGEMKNDWPIEALKAQAVLARTFVLRFCRDKTSKYEGADISTDVAEAQAYAPNSVNGRVERAVAETRGVAMAWEGGFPNVWFHAHSGGMTELPSVALEYRGEDPAYLKPRASEESGAAPAYVKSWRAVFTREQVARACADAGVKVDGAKAVALGERGESGRAKTLMVDGREVSAPSFRLQIGANRLRSTLIDEVRVEDDRVVFEGRGFGHGVGLSQWGAYAMAQSGDSAEQIVEYYFPGVKLVRLW